MGAYFKRLIYIRIIPLSVSFPLLKAYKDFPPALCCKSENSLLSPLSRATHLTEYKGLEPRPPVPDQSSKP